MKLKMRISSLYKVIVYLIGFYLIGCTEPFTLKTESFEDLLVIETTITNELKHQEIKISRTFLLESDVQIQETDANVKIEDSNQNTYNFTETENGIYVSDIAFQAIPGVNYKLLIVTSDNKSYESKQETLAPVAEINALYAELETVDGNLGIQVYVNSNEDIGVANYFRYEYEETYKIIPPFYRYFDAVADGDGIELIPRPPEQEVCYTTNYSNEILLTNVNDLDENAVSRFPIRFIPISDGVIRDRYSIEVKQYVQSEEAYNFYKILKELGTDVSVLVDNQPGFIQGNIFSQDNSNTKVIGYFNIASVTTSERIYFDYSDFELELPPYFFECELIELDFSMTDPVNEQLILLNALGGSQYKYVGENGSIYIIVDRACGDCTAFSSSFRPDFWVD